MEDASMKIYDVAKHLDELNKDGNVKGFNGNEKGYAKIIEIGRGCSIWMHHEKNDQLIIDLLVSPSAKEKNAKICDGAIKKFKDYFGFAIKNSIWNHSIDKHKNHDRYYVVVTEKNTTELVDLVDKIKKNFA